MYISRYLRVVPWAVLVASLRLATNCPAAPPHEPLDLAPNTSLLCWFGQPHPDAASADDGPSALQTLLDLGTHIAGGAIDRNAQLGVRMAEMFNLAISYPYALVLIDAQAKPLENDPNARRIDKLRFALIVDTPADHRGPNDPFLKLIQKTVNEQTSSDAAHLSTHQHHGWTYQQLSDSRLPDWSVIGWGYIDNCFVLTVGADVWPLIADVAAGQAKPLSRDEWYAAARRGHTELIAGPRRPLVEIFVAAHEIQRRLDPFVAGRASGFFGSWDADKLQRAHWSLGFVGRALYCVAHFQIGGDTCVRVYADPRHQPEHLLATVPSEARYAIYKLPLNRFLRRFFAGLVAIQGPKARANIRRSWEEIQQRFEVDADSDILANLGEYAVLHNFPQHPLRLPLAMTTLIEIRRQPERVRSAIERLCRGWQEVIDEAIVKSGRPPDFTLHRDSDGVWYLRFGLLDSLAWTTTDRFIITSWSSQALRQYLDQAGSLVGRQQ